MIIYVIYVCGDQRTTYPVRSYRKANAEQIAIKEVNAVYDRTVSEHSGHHSLLCLGLSRQRI